MPAAGADLLQRFEDGAINPAHFPHSDHVRVSFELLRKYEFAAAYLVMTERLQELTRRAGRPDRYNATITGAFMSIIGERMFTHEVGDFSQFADHNPDLFERSVLKSLYPPERLNCPAARRTLLLPAVPRS